MTTHDRTIYVVGMGPGARECILPGAIAAIERSDILIGGKRHLELFEALQKECYEISADLDDLRTYIKERYRNQQISVLASGDPGYYGILKFLQRSFDSSILEVIPGISSFQYLAAKCSVTWSDSFLSSLHGRSEDLVSLIEKNKKIFLLTDKKQNPQTIASTLVGLGFGKRKIVVGNKLSYDDEQILTLTAAELQNRQENYDLSVVMIYEA